MGWSDFHLNRFPIHGSAYGVEHEGGIWFSDNPERVCLADLQLRVCERFLYEYDFCDHWEHDVRLEKVLLAESERTVGGLGIKGRNSWLFHV